VVLKRVLFAAMTIALLGVLIATQTAAAQDGNQPDSETKELHKTALKEFSRSAKIYGVQYSFVLLNDKTVDALFSGSGKYAMRARANASTVFFVQGLTKDSAVLDPQFMVEQNGKTYEGIPINLKNFQPGSVVKGTRIEGLIQLSQKIDVTQPFKIRIGNDVCAEFELSPDAMRLLEN
jgi:hypothetical protein